MQPFAFDKKDVKRTKTDDTKSVEGRQKRSQAFFLGQKAIGCLKDAYDLLSGSLTLQVFKISICLTNLMSYKICKIMVSNRCSNDLVFCEVIIIIRAKGLH